MRNTRNMETGSQYGHLKQSPAYQPPQSKTVDGAPEALFDQEDSGLGSLNGYPSNISSFGIDTQDLDSSDNVSERLTPLTADSHTLNPAFRDMPESAQPLLSLTSQMGQLHLHHASNDSYEQPDPARLAAISKRHSGKHSCTSSDFDSGHYSIATNTSSDLAATDNLNNLNTDVDKGTIQVQAEEGLRCEQSGQHLSRQGQLVRPQIRHLPTPQDCVNLFAGDKDGDTCLHMCIIHRLEDLAEQLITIAMELDYLMLSYSNLNRQTPLHLAVLTGLTRLVRRLVCSGAVVDAQDSQGDTPLHLACKLGQEDIVRQLITPVRYEEIQGNPREIPYQRLLQDVRNSEGITPLHAAVLAGHECVVRMLVQAGADPNIADAKSGRTALHLATDWGRIDIVEFLVSTPEVDLSRRTYSGFTASQLAMGRGLVMLAQFLQPDGDGDLSDAESEMTLVDSDSDSDFDNCVME